MDVVEANSILDEARAWYKGDIKSSNKRYQPLSPPGKRERFKNFLLRRNPHEEEGASREKRELRNRRADAVDSGPLGPLQRLRDNPRAGTTYDGRGTYIFDNKIRFGNCGEMACLAAHLVRRRSAATRIFMVSLQAPGDHAFVCVNAAPLGTTLGNLSDNGSIAIDPWMNVCCHAALYETIARAKLSKWAGEGKLIRYKRVDTSPTSHQYISSLFQSELRIQDTSGTNILSGTTYGETFLLDDE